MNILKMILRYFLKLCLIVFLKKLIDLGYKITKVKLYLDIFIKMFIKYVSFRK